MLVDFSIKKCYSKLKELDTSKGSLFIPVGILLSYLEVAVSLLELLLVSIQLYQLWKEHRSKHNH